MVVFRGILFISLVEDNYVLFCFVIVSVYDHFTDLLIATLATFLCPFVSACDSF